MYRFQRSQKGGHSAILTSNRTQSAINLANPSFTYHPFDVKQKQNGIHLERKVRFRSTTQRLYWPLPTGICDWTLSNPATVEWAPETKNSPSILWLHALPASGKSILSSIVVNHFPGESLFVYSFFRFGDQPKCLLSTCLRTIALQIAEHLPQFRRALCDTEFATTTLERTDAKVIWEKYFSISCSV